MRINFLIWNIYSIFVYNSNIRHMGKSKKKPGTKQTLEYVEHPDKLHVKTIKCKNSRQKEFLNTME
jgi:hypothetical protein